MSHSKYVFVEETQTQTDTCKSNCLPFTLQQRTSEGFTKQIFPPLQPPTNQQTPQPTPDLTEFLLVCSRAGRDRNKPDRVVFDCQERAYWIVNRPPVSFCYKYSTYASISKPQLYEHLLRGV